MSWRESLYPARMERVALLAPVFALRDVLVAVADEGTVELDEDGTGPRPTSPTARTPAAGRLHRVTAGKAAPVLSAVPPDLDRCERQGRFGVLAGEAELERQADRAVVQGSVAGLTGWMPADGLPRLAGRVAPLGGAVVPLPRPTGVDPPTLLPARGAAREFAPLVETYATVPYADVNPALLAGAAYVLMFGMMFADVGHGALLLGLAVAVRLRWFGPLARLRPVWLFLAGAGAASMAFGSLYGEFFGPTGLIPVLWLEPLDNPVPLLGAAVGVGAVLLAAAYAVGGVNRFREGGWRRAVYAPSGLAGAGLFVGLAAVAGGVYLDRAWLAAAGGAVAAGGLAVAAAGLYAGAGGGGAGVAQAGVELLDLVLRLGSNLISFARLAAFGLTHAALGLVIWQGTTGLARHGVLGWLAAAAVFVVGNALAFALEGLVAAVQALRLEYYELFSRIFDRVGRPYRPWHVPLAETEVP